MVMLVWFILSLCGVCDFTRLPVFIDAILAAILLAAKEENNLGRDLLCIAAVGVASFAFYKFFFDLAISAWWILISPIATFVVMLFPGGLTIVNYLFKNFGLMNLPTWGLIVGIVLDVISLVFLIALIVDSIKSSKKNKKQKNYF